MVRVTKEEINLSLVYKTGFNKVREDLGNLLKRTFLSDRDSINSIIRLLNNIKVRRLEQINTLLDRTDDENILIKLQEEQEVLNRFTPSDLHHYVTGSNTRLELKKLPEIRRFVAFYGV